MTTIQFGRTQAFCNKLKELDLLEPMQAQFRLKTGAPLSLSVFMTINRERLKALSSEKLAELARTDKLELVYLLHLHSLRNISVLAERMAPQIVSEKAAEQGTERDVPGEEARIY